MVLFHYILKCFLKTLNKHSHNPHMGRTSLQRALAIANIIFTAPRKLFLLNSPLFSKQPSLKSINHRYPVDTGRKLNVHKTFRRRPRCLLNVLCTFNLRPVSTRYQLDLGRLAQWLETCARKPKVPCSGPAASYVQVKSIQYRPACV